MDDNGNKKLDLYEFENALNTYGLFPKKQDLQALMKYYDIDGDGNITYEEFLRGMRDELTERKKAMVEKAFKILDKDGSGKITVQDVINIYNVQQHPDFISGKKGKDEIISEFLNSFDGAKGNNDGVISRQEFFDYYTDLAMSTPSDEYFVRMIEQAWCVGEDEENSVFQDQVRKVVEMIR